MTPPSTPTEPSETRAHTFAVGDRVVAAVDITEGMVYGGKIDDDVMVMQGTGGIVIPFDWDDAPVLFNCHVLFDANEDGDCDSWYLNTAWLALVALAAPVPPERDDDDVIGEIVTALEAELTTVTNDMGTVRGFVYCKRWGERDAYKRALQIVRDIAGRVP